MEAVGAASAILSIATVGVQCSMKLMTFAGQIKTAPDQITKIAEEVSLNASILQQLGELAKENVGNGPPTSDDKDSSNDDMKSVHDAETAASKQSIFNAKGLGTVMSLAKNCEEIFNSLDQSLRKASKQLCAKLGNSGKVKLSHAEKFKWPFLLPGMDTLRNELQHVKGTLMLMLQVAMLAYSRKLMGQYEEHNKRGAAIIAYTREDQDLLVRSIVAAKKAHPGNTEKETSEASNIQSNKEIPLEEEQTQFSQPPVPFKNLATIMNPEQNSAAESASSEPDPTIVDNNTQGDERSSGINIGQRGDPSKQIPRSQRSSPRVSDVSILSPSPTFRVHIISPKASVREHQLHISYDDCCIRLPNSTVESQLQEWRTSSKATLLDQLSALDAREYAALVATTNRIDSSTFTGGEGETLKWVHFGEYRTLIEGIEQVKARNITMIMSGVYEPSSRFEKKEERLEFEGTQGATWIKARRSELDLFLIMAETVEQVHRKHLLPETLFAYGLPWDWDEGDSNYLIIKRWITEDFQEELFAHTRGIREGTVQLSNITTELRVNDRNKDKLYLIRNKKADSERRIRTFGDKEEEEGQETGAGGHDATTSDESDEDTEGIVDALLAEYTRG